MPERELLFSITKKDYEITYFNGTGKGGQHRNKHANCVRLKHKATGIIKVGQDQRSLDQNMRKAFQSMVQDKRFQDYIKLRASKESVNGDSIAEKVNKAMREENLKIEYV